MVMVEIMVPVIDKEYDFKLDEYATVAMIKEEIAEMVCHKEQSKLIGNEKQLLLCDYKSQRILEDMLTLKKQNIHTGDKLILV